MRAKTKISPPVHPMIDRARPWLLFSTILLFVARPLLPSEGSLVSGETLIFILLSFVIAGCWALGLVMRRGGPIRCGVVDIGVLLFVGCQTLSTVVALPDAAPRLALNTCWQWVSLVLLFWLVRQLVAGPREVRAVVAVMIALAVALSVFGFEQFFIGIPRDQALFAADPDAALREARVVAPPGSRQRVLFENRVNSSEPMATFALANSLAGFLVPWVTAALGICALAAARRNGNARQWLPAAIAAVVILACLALTKSRAAYVATAAGVVGLALWTVLASKRIAWWALGALVGLVAALTLAGTWVGALDRQVFTEAGKSLGYRWQYWQSSWSMIRAHPLFGVGPGQFQSVYAQYKLPTASEVVADPHNFLLEIWATSGTLVFATFLLLAFLILVRVVRNGSKENALGAFAAAHVDASLHILAAGLAGFVFAFALGPLAVVPLSLPACAGGLIAAAIALAALHPWVRDGQFSVALLGLAATTLLVNLLAGGGIGFAGVAGSLWLLAGLCLASVESPRRAPIVAGAALLALFAGAGGIFYFTVYTPVLACRLAMDRADADPERAEAHLRAASAADPASAEPYQRLAALEWAHWQRHPAPAGVQRFLEYIDAASQLDPHASPIVENKGDVCFEIFRRTGSQAELAAAIAAFRHAVALFPTSIPLHAKLAAALAADRQHDEAQREAAQALELDEATPHVDQKLHPEMRERLQAIAAGPN